MGAPDYTTLYDLSQLAAALFTADATGRSKFVAGFVDLTLLAAGTRTTRVRPRYGSISLAQLTVYMSPFWVANSGTEANAQQRMKATTIRNLWFYIGANTNNMATVFTLRKNGADVPGATVTVAAGATGWFAIAGLPVAYVDGDQCALASVNSGASTGTLTLSTIECEADN